MGHRGIALPVRNMRLPEVFRNQDLDRPTTQLLLAVAKHRHGLGVDECDTPVPADDEDAIR